MHLEEMGNICVADAPARVSGSGELAPQCAGLVNQQEGALGEEK